MCEKACVEAVVVKKVHDMSATMAILTIGVAPVAEVLPLLTEHIREEQITHISLLGKK